MTDWLEQSLIDIGLGWKESYDCYVSYGLTARSYTKQKYRKKVLLLGYKLEKTSKGIQMYMKKASFSVWPRAFVKK